MKPRNAMLCVPFILLSTSAAFANTLCVNATGTTGCYTKIQTAVPRLSRG